MSIAEEIANAASRLLNSLSRRRNLQARLWTFFGFRSLPGVREAVAIQHTQTQFEHEVKHIHPLTDLRRPVNFAENVVVPRGRGLKAPRQPGVSAQMYKTTRVRFEARDAVFDTICDRVCNQVKTSVPGHPHYKSPDKKRVLNNEADTAEELSERILYPAIELCNLLFQLLHHHHGYRVELCPQQTVGEKAPTHGVFGALMQSSDPDGRIDHAVAYSALQPGPTPAGAKVAFMEHKMHKSLDGCNWDAIAAATRAEPLPSAHESMKTVGNVVPQILLYVDNGYRHCMLGDGSKSICMEFTEREDAKGFFYHCLYWLPEQLERRGIINMIGSVAILISMALEHHTSTPPSNSNQPVPQTEIIRLLDLDRPPKQ
ncbi:hypothetical protein AURDEDRAFT_129225 [Auricularia subglabra TFB-10046 SS5]|nr:hypothetical protein AURDEDRAFT_129225 [Auricularia subglabra TFB-10046 SS5]